MKKIVLLVVMAALAVVCLPILVVVWCFPAGRRWWRDLRTGDLVDLGWRSQSDTYA